MEQTRGRFLPPRTETQIILSGKSPADFSSLRDTLLRRVSTTEKATGSLSLCGFDALYAAIVSFNEYMRRNHKANFDFFRHLLPHIHTCALAYTSEDRDREIDLLEAGVNRTVGLTRHRIRTILSNAFFLNTLCPRDFEGRAFGSIDLLQLYNFNSSIAKQRILCLLSYFAQAMDLDKDDVVSFERYRLVGDPPDWSTLAVKVDVGRVTVFKDRMEASDAKGFMDFANKALHVHSIILSAIQEEVLFSACPEAFVAILFCEEMLQDEIILIRNVRRFSEYTGYSTKFEFAGFYSTLRTHDIMAADATPVMHFTKYMVDRDLNKAYLGFKAALEGGAEKIATSHWGCGAFGGEHHLKFLQQVCASTLVGISLDYSAFGDCVLASNFKCLLDIIRTKELDISRVYDAMIGFQGKDNEFFHFVMQRLNHS